MSPSWPHTAAADDAVPPPAHAADIPRLTDAGPSEVTERRRLAIRWKPVGVAAGGMFLVLVASVTVFELATGRTLSETLRHEQGHGTPFIPVDPSRPAAPTPTRSPSSAPSSTPSGNGSAGPTPNLTGR